MGRTWNARRSGAPPTSASASAGSTAHSRRRRSCATAPSPHPAASPAATASTSVASAASGGGAEAAAGAGEAVRRRLLATELFVPAAAAALCGVRRDELRLHAAGCRQLTCPAARGVRVGGVVFDAGADASTLAVGGTCRLRLLQAAVHAPGRAAAREEVFLAATLCTHVLDKLMAADKAARATWREAYSQAREEVSAGAGAAGAADGSGTGAGSGDGGGGNGGGRAGVDAAVAVAAAARLGADLQEAEEVGVDWRGYAADAATRASALADRLLVEGFCVRGGSGIDGDDLAVDDDGWEDDGWDELIRAVTLPMWEGQVLEGAGRPDAEGRVDIAGPAVTGGLAEARLRFRALPDAVTALCLGELGDEDEEGEDEGEGEGDGEEAGW
ncbi:hypothetical protein GPECTOR_550g564 [Gonium pectorale]|uniref:Uncharacterized protein n=1 Tax=Gonium pectorale TaxID=33097 RepID=A0A150FVU4_GONPE|nr:hypothetical protein GPECTOR_550g564 [Gonium pectorale]|eukprot:KXZ41325.1 hypothetical protein GPECTOR_550g564 [Gonium pectorale]